MQYIVVGPVPATGMSYVAYPLTGSPVHAVHLEFTSHDAAVRECERLNTFDAGAPPAGPDVPGKKIRVKREERRFADWIAECKSKNTRPVPEDDPVFAYAADVGLPEDFLRLAWIEFQRKFNDPKARKYKNWNQHFQNAVRENWFRLWFFKDDSYALTTRGMQTELELKAKQKNEQRN